MCTRESGKSNLTEISCVLSRWNLDPIDHLGRLVVEDSLRNLPELRPWETNEMFVEVVR